MFALFGLRSTFTQCRAHVKIHMHWKFWICKTAKLQRLYPDILCCSVLYTNSNIPWAIFYDCLPSSLASTLINVILSNFTQLRDRKFAAISFPTQSKHSNEPQRWFEQIPKFCLFHFTSASILQSST